MPAPTSSVKRDRTDRPHSDPPAPHLDSPGEVVWRFGKFRGQRMRDIPDEYLAYIAANTYDFEQLALVEAELAERNADLLEDPFQVAEPSGKLAEHVLPLVTYEWERAMLGEFGVPDPTSDAAFVLDRGVAHLRTICTRHTGRRFPIPGEMEGDGADRS